jgi:hypothetical protein
MVVMVGAALPLSGCSSAVGPSPAASKPAQLDCGHYMKLGDAARAKVATSVSASSPQLIAFTATGTSKKPRIFLGTFWLAITVLLAAVGFAIPAGDCWCILLAIATLAYSIYLYRGGRYGFWFF